MSIGATRETEVAALSDLSAQRPFVPFVSLTPRNVPSKLPRRVPFHTCSGANVFAPSA